MEKKIEDMTPELILSGWKYHNEQKPMAYAILSEGDWVASNCWSFLMGQKMGNTQSVEDFCKKLKPKAKREQLITIIKDVKKLEEDTHEK